MTNKLKQFVDWGLIGALLIIFLSGCQAVTTAQPQNTIPARQSPAVTMTVKSEETEIPSPSPTLEVTWTPLPTLSAIDAENRIKELLLNNGGCELPCWWGITPGESTWESTRHVLQPFVTLFGAGESMIYKKEENSFLISNYSVRYSWEDNSEPGLIIFGLMNEFIDYIWIKPRGTELRYTINQLLSDYGKPDKIWIEVDADWNTFSFLLYYPDRGITALYNQKAEQKDAFYRLCLDDSGPELWLWSPGKVFEYNEGGFIGPTFGFGPGGHEIYMQPIETIGLEMDTFVQIYGRENPGCYTTNQDRWRVP